MAAPAEQAAARRNERGHDRIPLWAGKERSDWVGIKASPGVSLAIPIFLLQTPSPRMVWSQHLGIWLGIPDDCHHH